MNFAYIKKIKNKTGRSENDFPLRLSLNEKNFLTGCLIEAENYLEFGSGGSTFLALMSGCKKIVSVESDNNWIDNLKTFSLIQQGLDEKRLYFEYINTGKTGEWGVPVEESQKELFPDYSKEVFEKFENDYGLVFIDGRFRVACVLQTILNCRKDVKIVMHDYNNRPEYHYILKYLNIDYTIDTMAQFSIKNNIDKNDVLISYENYKYNCR